MKRAAGEVSALQVRKSTCMLTGAYEGMFVPLCIRVGIPTNARVHL